MRISDWISDVCSSDLRVYDNPVAGGGPVLLAERVENPVLPTVLGYGHGDVVLGDDANWRSGLSPWRVQRDGDRLYGRGTADSKGQPTIHKLADRKRGEYGKSGAMRVEIGGQRI